MIEFLKTWTNQIIIAVIIATILEMLVPEGKNKKYVKMVIGIYVLFCIIQPMITKITGINFTISDFNYKKYFDEEIVQATSQDFERNNSKLIKQAYIDNIKNNIKTKIKQKGYQTLILDIVIIEDEDMKLYGTIKSINLTVEKINKDNTKTKEESINKVKIENIDINKNENNRNNNTNINESNNIGEKTSISEKQKIEIIEYLSNEYSIDKKNIIIN